MQKARHGSPSVTRRPSHGGRKPTLGPPGLLTHLTPARLSSRRVSGNWIACLLRKTAKRFGACHFVGPIEGRGRESPAQDAATSDIQEFGGRTAFYRERFPCFAFMMRRGSAESVVTTPMSAETPANQSSPQE